MGFDAKKPVQTRAGGLARIIHRRSRAVFRRLGREWPQPLVVELVDPVGNVTFAAYGADGIFVPGQVGLFDLVNVTVKPTKRKRT